MNKKIKNKISIVSAIGLVVAGLTSLPSMANTEDCVVDDFSGGTETGTLRHCLDNISAGGTITFDTNAEVTITITSRLKLYETNYTIDGTGNLSNQEAPKQGGKVTIKRGSDFEDSMLEIDGEDAVLKNITFDGNEIEVDGIHGGAIYTEKDVTVTDSVFMDNKLKTGSDKNGGAIAVGFEDEARIGVTGSKFTGNHSTDKGGAIFVNALPSDGDDLYFENSTFENNTSDDDGGAIAIEDANDFTARVSDSVFKNNKALGDKDGGAIYVEDNLLINQNSVFWDNIAGDDGGAIYAKDFVTVRDSEFKRNITTNNGGAIYSSGEDVDSYDSTFEKNEAAQGGAIYADTDVIAEGSTFSENLAVPSTKEQEAKGAAIFSEDGNSTVDDSIFLDNIADDEGGAIYIEDSTGSSISNTLFQGNHAKDGLGGAILSSVSSNTGDLEIISSSFVDNKSKDDGGAVRQHNSQILIVNNSFFSGNEAGAFSGTGSDGGALDGGSIFVTNSTFTNNSAVGSGGGVYSDNNSSQIAFNTFLNNTAANGNSVAVDGSDAGLFANLLTGESSDPHLDSAGGGTYTDHGGNASTSEEALLTAETSTDSLSFSELGAGDAQTATKSIQPVVPFSGLVSTGVEITQDLVSTYSNTADFQTDIGEELDTTDQLGTNRTGNFFPGAEFVTFSTPSSSPFSAPAPFAGPIVTSVNGSSLNSPVSVSSGQELTITGDRLNLVSKVMIEDQEASITDKDSDELVVSLPEDLTAGTYDLLIEGSFGKVTYNQGLTVSSEDSAIESYGELNAWTKRISETEAKVYVKFPQVGNRIQITHQTGGSGEYSPVVTRTVTSTTDEFLTVNEVGTYFVRTINLEDINRIRVIVDGEKLVQVIYK